MKKTQIVLIIVGVLILLSGTFYFLGKETEETEETEEIKLETLIAELSESKIIKELNAEELSAVAFGEVVEISGHNLTLSKEGDTLTISIKEEATTVHLVSYQEEPEAPPILIEEKIEFEEIKIGERANIVCELKKDGFLEGKRIIIWPPL